jgi:hypothetical protein
MGWEAVGRASAPIAAEPAVIAAQADHLGAVARVLRDQVAQLRQVNADSQALRWDSEAAEPFRQVVGHLPDDLERLATRYDTVAGALVAFNGTVRAARDRAEDGMRRASAAAAEVAAAEAGVLRMDDHGRQARAAADTVNAGRPPGQPAAVPEPWTGPDHHEGLRLAQRALAAAREQVDEAARAFHEAGAVAAAAVDRASHDGLEDNTTIWGRIEHAAGWVADHVPLKAIASVLAKVSAVFGLLSLIPGPWSVAFAFVAAAAALAVFVCDLLSTMAADVRQGGGAWTPAAVATLGIDALCVAAGVAACGTGLQAIRAAKSAATAARAAGAAEAGARAASAARAGTATTVAARESRLAGLASGWAGPLNRVFGRVARAERELATAESELSTARQAEARAAAEAGVRAAEAREAAAVADHADRVSNLVGLVTSPSIAAGPITTSVTAMTVDGKGALEAAFVPGGIGNVAVLDTNSDVHALVDFYRNGGEATSSGSGLTPRPIG